MNSCSDNNCGIHGKISKRGRNFVGTVVESKAQKTATVEWSRTKKLPKYERYTKARTKIKVHNPDCISAKKGDVVKIMECRPISKTKSFVIMKKVGQDIEFMAKEELFKEAKKVIESKSRKPKKEDGKDTEGQNESS